MTPEKLCQDLGTYYDKPLTTTQAIPIIKHIDHYPVEKLRELFSLIVNNCEFLPKLSRIVDLSEQLGSINKVGCPKCDWTGIRGGQDKSDRTSKQNEALTAKSRIVHDYYATQVVSMCDCRPRKVILSRTLIQFDKMA